MTDNMKNEWLDMIAKVYSNLHNTDRVLKAASLSDKKRERLAKFFDRMDEVHKHVADTKSINGDRSLKHFYHELYVIKPQDIPDAYFQNQVKIARERGYGNIELTETEKKEMANQVVDDQKRTLDNWIDYFLYDDESKSYEMWEKYWVFQGLQELGKYDKEKGKFSKRDKTTVYPFPPVEREFIFTTLKLMEDFLKSKKSDDEIRNALNSGNFKQLYEYVIKQSLLRGERKSVATDGKWVKYEQGSDYHLLHDSLQGYYTGWCTAAGENFAKGQLADGDFYVYYSLDEHGEAKVPRIAIRMDGHYKIGEIRGIAQSQNMEPEMLPILNEKLKAFPDKDEYLKKEEDMKLLTLIDNKMNKGIELDFDELTFLYEVKSKINGFGHGKDPRIDEIRAKRDVKNDCSILFSVFTKYEGNLNLNYLTTAQGLVLPKEFNGKLDLNGLTSGNDLVLPEKFRGSLELNGLTNTQNLVLPKDFNGCLELNGLTKVETLLVPQKFNGKLKLRNLIDASGVIFPEEFNGDLELGSLSTTDGLVLPKKMNGWLDLNDLSSAENLVLPKEFNGGIRANSLKSAKGLVLPEKMDKDLLLDGLTSADGLILPEVVGGKLSLNGLTKVDKLVLPKKCSALNLMGLVDATGVVFPEEFKGNLELVSLSTTDGLVLPKKMNGWLDLNGLSSAKNLVLPKEFHGSIRANNLKFAKGLVFPEKIDGALLLDGLTSADGLILPEIVEGELSLNGLTKVDKLVLPKKCKNLNLMNLVDATGIVFPEEVSKSLLLTNLKKADGLVLPQKVGLLALNNLTNPEGLVLPKVVEKVDLENLKTCKGLKVPYGFDMTKIYCSDRRITEELKNNPENYYIDAPDKNKTDVKEEYCEKMIELITRKLDSDIELDNDEINFLNNTEIYLGTLYNNKDIIDKIENLKQRVESKNKDTIYNGNLDLKNITNAEGLVLPRILNGNLNLDGLTNARGLVLPEVINGNLSLNGIISPEGLVLPKRCKSIKLNSLTSAEGLIFPDTIVGVLNLSSLRIPDGLVLPKDEVGELYLPNLVSARGLIIPKKIIEDVNLSSLQDAEGLKIYPDFDLNCIDCDYEIKEEIMNNPEKYYVIEEELEENTERGR